MAVKSHRLTADGEVYEKCIYWCRTARSAPPLIRSSRLQRKPNVYSSCFSQHQLQFGNMQVWESLWCHQHHDEFCAASMLSPLLGLRWPEFARLSSGHCRVPAPCQQPSSGARAASVGFLPIGRWQWGGGPSLKSANHQKLLGTLQTLHQVNYKAV